MEITDIREEILVALKSLDSLDKLKRLFWEFLNYDSANDPISTIIWSDVALDAIADSPLIFARAGSSQDETFNIIYIPMKGERLLLGAERLVVSALNLQYPNSLFVFSNNSRRFWHFVNVKDARREPGKAKRLLLRRISVGPNERLRTATERISLLDVERMQHDLFGLSQIEIRNRYNEAFDVEKVTKEFFIQYQSVFHRLKDDLSQQTGDARWAHDASLQVLNRIMFLYFIQRKGWLDGNPEFIGNFWRAYRTSSSEEDTFYRDWLSVMFFRAFNRTFNKGYRQFPDQIATALQHAPFLNGGLFTENELDRRHGAAIADQHFERIFGLLDQYNFTISEDSPLDQEVAVDPEMIGKVYESLVNVQEETNDQRSAAGIFYTPRTEIDLMCRLTLVDYLTNHLGDQHKNDLYEVVFALDPLEKADADKRITGLNLWWGIDSLLRTVTVVDPACGSGSFLVGMLHVLDDLQERANQQLHVQEELYERRRRIIGQSLYGVDVKDWAIHVAELRLWLALIIDAQFSPEELIVRAEPLLPHFSFKLRVGDSLVQEIGGVNFAQWRGARQIKPHLKKRISTLQVEKLKFYNNATQKQLTSLSAAQQAERNLFSDILDSVYKENEERLKELRRNLGGPGTTQLGIFGQSEIRQQSMEMKSWKREETFLLQAQESLAKARKALHAAKVVPFVWDIAFVEIFDGERAGFDIVIGNPPYVRNEKIADPTLSPDSITAPKRRAYKEKLKRSAQSSFPRFFGYDPVRGTYRKEINGRSDLYLYFFFQGLSLLDGKGSFCFITSNSWLDAAFGTILQEFILDHGLIEAVIDNHAKRSFSEADINTVITLLSAPKVDSSKATKEEARFVAFRVPFEEVLHPAIFQEIAEADASRSTKEYRLHIVSLSQLRGVGSVFPSEAALAPTTSPDGTTEDGEYVGGKWGGRYLTSHDIFWTVLKKGADLLEPLNCHVRGERYLNTGGADGFFILEDVQELDDDLAYIRNSRPEDGNRPFDGPIEKKYLRPLIKDYVRRDRRYEIHGHDTYCLVITEQPSAMLEEYIHWGEAQRYHQRSGIVGRRPWYRPTVQMLRGAPLLLPRSFDRSHPIYFNPRDYLSLRFYRLHPRVPEDTKQLAALLNSTLMALFLETLGNKALGQGVLEFPMTGLLRIEMPIVLDQELANVFDKMGNSGVQDAYSEYGQTDGTYSPISYRATIDSFIFDRLALTTGERDAVYEAVISSMDMRTSRANSLRV